MLSRSKVQKQVNKLPKNFSLDELIERLIITEKVEIGENQSLNNETISEKKMDKTIKKWFK